MTQRSREVDSQVRVPRTPKPVAALLSEAVKHPKRITAWFGGSPVVNGRYVHWDKLRNLKPPGDLSHEEWWLSIKMQRQSLYKEVPLRDLNGGPFRFTVVDPIPERVHEIDLGAGGLIQMPEQITNPETRDQYYVGSLMEEAITSSQLEGATTTRAVAKEMIRAGREPRDKSEQMILNNYRTMRRIGSFKSELLTKDLVLEIHQIITDATLEKPEAAGRFRLPHEAVYVSDEYGHVFHTPPHASTLDERCEAMCEFANGKTPDAFVHPAIRSIILHFWLAYDHPFVDGNGRTARALFYWSMLRYGFWLCKFISISKILLAAPIQYGRAFLHTETDDNDLTYFILYHLEVIRRAVEELHEYIARKSKQLRALAAELRDVSVLNHRQRALIGHALRHPHRKYTVESHRVSHNVVYETARSDLMDLKRRGLLTASKAGKRWLFSPVPSLESRLSQLA